jgi:hypothetical protein
LEILVDGEKLSPADTFASVPYALVASTALFVAGGTVNDAALADGAVSTAKIADRAVTSAKVGVGAVGSAHLAESAVVNAKVAADAAIDSSKIALTPAVSLRQWQSESDPGRINPQMIYSDADPDGGSTIGANTVNSLSVVDESLASEDLSPGAVTRPKINTDSFAAHGPGLIPPGSILLWPGPGSCPAGFSPFPGFNGRFIRGADSAGETGGSETHTHNIAHTHSLSGHTHGGTTDSGGVDHNHGGTTAENSIISEPVSSGGQRELAPKRHTHAFTTGGASQYQHAHGVTTGGPSTGQTGDADAATVTGTHIPPYVNVLFCQKD